MSSSVRNRVPAGEPTAQLLENTCIRGSRRSQLVRRVMQVMDEPTARITGHSPSQWLTYSVSKVVDGSDRITLRSRGWYPVGNALRIAAGGVTELVEKTHPLLVTTPDLRSDKYITPPTRPRAVLCRAHSAKSRRGVKASRRTRGLTDLRMADSHIRDSRVQPPQSFQPKARPRSVALSEHFEPIDAS